MAKKTLHILSAVAATGLGAVYLVAPGRCLSAQRAPFQGRNFAHRGLYAPLSGIPENSLAAFRAAAAAGYGAELDVRLSRDGAVVVSHDNDLRRMTGAHATVDGSSLEELRQLRLEGSREGIPLLEEALEALGGVPVIVEVKPVARRRELCEKTLALLRGYPGDYCVESFDPLAVRWFRRHAPDVLRGQLTGQGRALHSGPAGFLLSLGITNFLCRPQFIAHHLGPKSLGVQLCEALGAMRVRWTARDGSWEQGSDAVIFEGFRPPVRFAREDRHDS